MAAMVQAPDIDIDEVFDAVDSLYWDRLKPYGRILLQRFNQEADVPIRGRDRHDQLRRACEANPSRVVVVPATGPDEDWYARIPGRAENFVDCMSLEDPYTPQFWRDFRNYFEDQHARGQVEPLPAGRTACAEALKDRGLPFLEDLMLGDVCHIVELALLEPEPILGRTRLRGQRCIVPYAGSEDKIKVECALLRQPYRPKVGRDMVDDWATMERCLQAVVAEDILAGGVPTANIRHIFRNRFNKELYPTRLGHPTLVKLLLDPRLRHLCSVDLRGDKFVVVPLAALVPRRPRWADIVDDGDDVAGLD